MKKLNNAGLTLVELLASLVLVTIISIALFSMIVSAIDNNRVIQQDNLLRDEADLLMSKIFKAIYSTNQTSIIHNTSLNGESNILASTPSTCVTLPNNTYKNTETCKNHFLEITTDIMKCLKNEAGQLINRTQCATTLQPLGFSTDSAKTKLYILDEVIEPSLSSIKILPTSKITGDPSSSNNYEVHLHLEITQTRSGKTKTKQLDFINEIQPIVQTKGSY